MRVRVRVLVMVNVIVLVLVLVIVPAIARAGSSDSDSVSESDSVSVSESDSVSASAPESGPASAAYLELFGRGGAYGVGYEIALTRRFALGAAASFLAVDGERVTTVSPYLHAVIAAGGVHAWFADAGPALTHLSIPSPVPEWDGVSSTSVGGVVSTGYQVGTRLFLRTSISLAFGPGGVAPWGGVAIGARF